VRERMSRTQVEYTLSMPLKHARHAAIIWLVADILADSEDLQGEGLESLDAPDVADNLTVLIEAIRDGVISTPKNIICAWDYPNKWKLLGAMCADIAAMIDKANAYTDDEQDAIRAEYYRTHQVPD
jgi:hypothetical protein